MRMFLELLFKIVVPEYVPGKFRSMTGPFSDWMARRRHFLKPYVLTWLLYIILCSLGVTVRAASAPAAGVPFACANGPWVSVERHYVVSGRIRPFFVWLGRYEVGDARLAWRNSADEMTQLELLIGTDPQRAPLQINRWGYLAETQCGPRSTLVGVMTESDEATLSQAQTSVSAPGATGAPLKAIRSSLSGGETRTELISLTPAGLVTYRNLDGVLALMPARSQPRIARVDTAARSGFLAAMTDVLHQTATDFRASGRIPRRLVRTYVYDGRVYDMALTEAAALTELVAGGRTHPRPLQADFEVRNRSTGEVSSFTVTYGTTGEFAEVPLRVVYHPRWWIELQLDLNR